VVIVAKLKFEAKLALIERRRSIEIINVEVYISNVHLPILADGLAVVLNTCLLSLIEASDHGDLSGEDFPKVYFEGWALQDLNL